VYFVIFVVKFMNNAGQYLFYFSALFFSINCSDAPKPEPIHVGEDLCAACRMAIIEPQFATEMVLASGEMRKYDDLACLAKGMQSAAAGERRQIFLQDYSTREWITREPAFVVMGSKVQTPMGSGGVAFGNRQAAEKFVAENGGALMRLEEFLKP
jgi:copper chaperone NosL